MNVTFRQYRWTEFADILTEIGTDPFINEGQDMVAGWTMNISFSIFNEGDWCAIPYDSYDFENGYTPPSAACADANYSITDDSANILYSGTIASGGSLNQIISDSTAVLKNTANTILSTTSINAEASADIVAPDAHVHLKKEDDGTIDNVFVPSGVTQNYVIQNNDISVNGVFEFDIHATDPLDIRLRDTSSNVITPVSVTDSGMHATIVLPDTTIEVNGVAEGSVVAGSTVDVLTNIVPSSSSLVGSNLTLTFTKELFWELNYNDTDDIIFIPATANNVGTLTSGSGANVGTIDVSTDGVSYSALSFPFTPVNGTTYYFKRSTATVTGSYTMTGTYA